MQQADPYVVLGVARGSDAKAIRYAYRRKSRTLHPDKGGDAVSFQKLSDAYSILSDPILQRQYDRQFDDAKNNATWEFHRPRRRSRRSSQSNDLDKVRSDVLAGTLLLVLYIITALNSVAFVGGGVTLRSFVMFQTICLVLPLLVHCGMFRLGFASPRMLILAQCFGVAGGVVAVGLLMAMAKGIGSLAPHDCYMVAGSKCACAPHSSNTVFAQRHDEKLIGNYKFKSVSDMNGKAKAQSHLWS